MRRNFLFLQGPTNLLFARTAQRLRGVGHEAWRVNVCVGDQIFWKGKNALAFRGPASEWPAWLDALCGRVGITDIVLLGEKRRLHRLAIDAARNRGIDVTVTDFGYLRPDWIVVERDGMNGGSRFPRDAGAVMQLAKGLPRASPSIQFPHRAAKQALLDMTFNLSSSLAPWTFPHFERHTLNHPLLNYAGTGWRMARSPWEAARARSTLERLSGRRYFVFAMQMEDDFSVRAYSTFPDMESAMRRALRSFVEWAPGDAHIVFKLHPLDPGLRQWRSIVQRLGRELGVASRVHFIDGGDLDLILRASAGLVTVNSTAGIRAIELGVAALPLGEAIYSIAGVAPVGDEKVFWSGEWRPAPELCEAFLRALGATVHVRGSMYDRAGIEAAADGMAYRLHHGLVNVPVPEVLTGVPLSLWR